MKNKLTTILAILSMGCAVWLVGENRALKQINDGLLLDNVTLVKHKLWMEEQYVDLEAEYSKLFDLYMEEE